MWGDNGVRRLSRRGRDSDSSPHSPFQNPHFPRTIYLHSAPSLSPPDLRSIRRGIWELVEAAQTFSRPLRGSLDMPAERIPRYDGEHAIVHLSDLHFGSPNYQEVWSLTNEFLREIEPDLLLVTGDLVDSPKKKLYEEVKKSLDELRIQYFVCAGNHDRFYRGNQFPAWTQTLIRAGCLLVFALSVGTLLYLWYIGAGGWIVPILVGVVLVFAFGGCLFPDRLLWIWTRLKVDDHFSEVFLGRILTHETLQTIKIPQRASESSGPETSGLVDRPARR